MESKLLYLTHPVLECWESRILDIRAHGSETAVFLDETPFYPKGGGQPADRGVLTSPTGVFSVCNVEREGKIVRHVGVISAGSLAPHQVVRAAIDARHRRLTSRIHTAGELICAAAHELGFRWRVSAATHAPDQSRVAFATELAPASVSSVSNDLQAMLKHIVSRADPVRTFLDVSVADARRLCPLEPIDAIAAHGPIRLVSPSREFHRPCMGAHLTNTTDVGAVAFKKIRLRDGDLSISYDVERAD